MHAFLRLLLAIATLFAAMPTVAGDPCPRLRLQATAVDVSTRIAAIACAENHAWYRSFIDADGRAGGQAVYEAENDTLADGMQAWKKVAGYWNGSGLPGSCDAVGPACRSFVVDTPWSAAFVSWVMRRAGVRGFATSARHLDYVRAAWGNTVHSPYRMAAPGEEAPATGDLLCYVRANARVLGHRGLVDHLGNGSGLAMHCDIVVGVEAGGLAWLVGGNVQQAVTLRMLRLDAQGRLSDLPQRGAGDAACSPDAPASCNLNRQDWAALLKLQPATTPAPASLLAANAP